MKYQKFDIVKTIAVPDKKPDYRLLLVTDVRTKTVTGEILDQSMNRVIEYGKPVYRCVSQEDIEELVLPQIEVHKQTELICTRL
jgi:hypothetical protein